MFDLASMPGPVGRAPWVLWLHAPVEAPVDTDNSLGDFPGRCPAPAAKGGKVNPVNDKLGIVTQVAQSGTFGGIFKLEMLNVKRLCGPRGVSSLGFS